MGNKECVEKLQNELDNDGSPGEYSDEHDHEVLRSCGSNGSSTSEYETRINTHHESPPTRAALKPNLHAVHSVRKKKDANQEEDDKGFGGNTARKLDPEFAEDEFTEFRDCLEMVRAAMTAPLNASAGAADVPSFRERLVQDHAAKIREATITINISSACEFLRFGLKDPDQNLVKKVLTKFGDVVGKDCKMRDEFLSHFLKNNANPLLEAMEDMGIDQLSLLRVAAETLSKFCRKPVPAFDLIERALPTVARLILFEDQELLYSAFSILNAYEDNVDAVLEKVPLEHLVQLMFADENQSLSDDCRFEFAKCLGNIAAVRDSDRLIYAGVLPHWRNMLRHPDPRFRAEACFSLGSVLCEKDNRPKVLAYEDIIPRVVELMMVTLVAAQLRTNLM
jgi:hypothetical protein